MKSGEFEGQISPSSNMSRTSYKNMGPKHIQSNLVLGQSARSGSLYQQN